MQRPEMLIFLAKYRFRARSAILCVYVCLCSNLAKIEVLAKKAFALTNGQETDFGLDKVDQPDLNSSVKRHKSPSLFWRAVRSLFQVFSLMISLVQLWPKKFLLVSQPILEPVQDLESAFEKKSHFSLLHHRSIKCCTARLPPRTRRAFPRGL